MSNDVATLILPGMTTNGSLFPDLTGPVFAPDFNRQVFSEDGSLPGHPDGPMGPYLDELEQLLDSWGPWRTSRHRVVIGHSFGGMLLLQWMLTRAPAVHAAILVATTAGPMFSAVRIRSRLGLRIPSAGLIRLWNTVTVTRLAKRFFGDVGRAVDFSQLESRSDAAVDRAGWQHTDWRSMRSYRNAMRGFDVRDQLPAIQVPVHVLHGDRDTLFPVHEGTRLANGLPRATRELVRGAGHALPLTHPDRIVEHHRTLLSEL